MPVTTPGAYRRPLHLHFSIHNPSVPGQEMGFGVPKVLLVLPPLDTRVPGATRIAALMRLLLLEVVMA